MAKAAGIKLAARGRPIAPEKRTKIDVVVDARPVGSVKIA
jgi:hypothetical protein